MNTLNIEQFNPQKAELSLFVEECKNLVINGVEDRKGFEQVDEYRKKLKNFRVEIQKTGKMMRDDAIKFQKAVIAKENELVAIIEPTERELQEKQQVIKDELAKITRQYKLPERKELLNKINLSVADDFILLMDDNQFQEFYNNKNTEYLEAERLKIENERLKIEAEKLKIEEENRKKIEIEKAKKELQKKLEQEKQNALEAERKKAEKEKQDIVNEYNRKEQEKQNALEAERKQKQDEETQKLNEQKKMEKEKNYKLFLSKNNYNDKEFLLKDFGDKIIMYKFVDEYVK